MRDTFSLMPRCGLLLLIVWAPAAMGSIPAWAETILVEGCFLVAFLHFFDFLSRRGWRDGFWWPLALVAAALLQGWLMAANAKYLYAEPLDRLVPLPALLNPWPGSFDREASLRLMSRLTAFAAVFAMVLDLSRDPAWRRRILLTMGFTGIGLTAFGILENTLQVTGMWPQYGHNVWPFATYFYHGNAGAFINLVVPLIVAFTARAFFFAVNPWWRSLWVLGLAILIAGAFINASKAAQAIFLVVLAASFLPWLRLMRRSLFRPATLLRGAIVLPVFAAAVGGVVYFGGLGEALARWVQAIHYTLLVSVGRLGVAHVCLRLIPHAGIWGFGPGSFTRLFPYATWPEGAALRGFWHFAHEDYLQSVIEWGWGGAALWALFFFGGLFSAFFLAIRPRLRLRLRTRLLLGAAGCGLAGCALHALVDFPLQIPSLEFYVFLFLALGWGAWRWPEEGRARH